MSIRLKIMALPAIVMLVVISGSFIALEYYLKSTLEERIDIELMHTASSVVESIHSLDLSSGYSALDKLADQVGEVTETRVTILDSSGKVLGDTYYSLHEIEQLSNQKHQPEIAEAIVSGKGMSRRHSFRAHNEFHYIAMRDRHEELHHPDHTPHAHQHEDEQYPESSSDHGTVEEHPFIARVGVPDTYIHDAVVRQRYIFIVVGLISLAASAILGYSVSGFLAGQIEIKQKLMEEEVKERTREITLLQTLGGLLNTCTSLEEASDVLIKILPKLLPHTKGAISVIKASRDHLNILATWGNDWPGAGTYGPDDCWALRKGHRHTSHQQDIHVPCPHMNADHNDPSICIPLLAQGDTLGVMHLTCSEEHFTSMNEQLAISIAENVGLAIANLQLKESLRQQAIKDPLTGLFNRRYLTEALNQALDRTNRQSSVLSLCMLDLDHFKRFNDTFGHDAGDYVLKSVANVLKSRSRASDTASRYGGEEFCLFFPDTSKQEVQNIAENLCESVRQLNLTYKLESLGSITLSIGIAVFPEHATSSDDLIKRADQCLYEAKIAGRDQVVIARDDD